MEKSGKGVEIALGNLLHVREMRAGHKTGSERKGGEVGM